MILEFLFLPPAALSETLRIWEFWVLLLDLLLLNEKVLLLSQGPKNWVIFKFIERDIKKVGDSIKRLIKDLAQDTKDGDADYRQEIKELQNFYKKYVIEMDVKFKQFKRKNT